MHMAPNGQSRLVLDAKKSWSNLPFALMPLSVGVALMVYPWVGGMETSMTAPIMIPFGLVWVMIAACINGYHSELVLDSNQNEISYKSSLVFHSWSNSVARENVNRVVLSKESGRYRFVVEVKEGEDLSITTFDYWRSREWSERVATFFQVPLEDLCRDEGELSPAELVRSSLETQLQDNFDPTPPGKIAIARQGERSLTIRIPPRGLLPSARPRLALALFALVGGGLGFFMLPEWRWLSLASGFAISLCLVARPLAQATHHEELEVSPHGLLATVVILGRSIQRSVAGKDIRQVTVLRGSDDRFDRSDFDRHAVCVEGTGSHLQLGEHLPRPEQVRWLQQTLIRGLCGDLEVFS